MNKETIYEVFALSAFGSDVIEKYSLDEALECAKEWSLESTNKTIMVVKVERSKILIFEKGEQK